MSTALVWFRRDLRDFDHAALYHALAENDCVYCLFVFDRSILDELRNRTDCRVAFIHSSIEELHMRLLQRGGGLCVCHGNATEEVPRMAARLGVDRVYANRDYEPQAIDRDAKIAASLQEMGIEFTDFKDQVIHERGEVLTQAGKPFGVFTPYRNAWLRHLAAYGLPAWPIDGLPGRFIPPPEGSIPSLAELGFSSDGSYPALPTGVSGGEALWSDFRDRIDHYRETRDFPARKGASYLSVHLRFGTVSIRELVRHAWERGGIGAETWLSELVWREFYQQILFHHPHVVEHAWRSEYDAIRWEEGAAADAAFAAWSEGRTGYPIVDAGMRQLNQTGYMHNRLRMITASFLTKDLGIHWLRGERYFAAQLNDYDLAANNGGWQWCASTGCDAQPWFRIFNPVTQSERFDPGGKFIRRYVPELAKVPDKFIHAPWKLSPIEQASIGCAIGRDYPAPIVDHAVAREKTLARFKQVDRK